MSCKDCPDRKVTADYNCHSHCADYLAEVEARKERKEAVKKTQTQSAEIGAYFSNLNDRINKMRFKKNRR